MKKTIPHIVVEDMYESAPKVYPREIGGRFQRLRKIAVFWLLGMFYLFPWLNWDGRQAVLFDLPARKFYIFGLGFWPQDFFYLSMLLMMAAFSLFLFTALAGRLWCGYACPQTVWTEVFLWFERWVEGSRQQRIKLDQAPWSWRKLRIKSIKQFLWITFALWTGFTFVGFFTPIRVLATEIQMGYVGGWELFWMLFYSFATYGNAGYLREQVCKYMCPYARFQGAMFDPNTLIISYDQQRGEQRGARRKNADYKSLGLGDCIDCTICVQVCPTGIDIRDGLQYECIACGACVDACNEVMDKMGYPRNLVTYATQNTMDKKPSKIWRPRIVIYTAILLVLLSGFIFAVSTRTLIHVDVLRDRNALFRQTASGDIENTYTLKILNKDQVSHEVDITLDASNGIQFRKKRMAVVLPPETLLPVPVTLFVEQGVVHGRFDISFHITDINDKAVTHSQSSTFFAPE